MFGMGLVLGALGGGGGILTVPILAFLYGLPAEVATGSSLFVVGATSLVGSVRILRERPADVRKAASIAVPSSLGAFAARQWLVPSIPSQIGSFSKQQALLGMFAVLMLVVGTQMLRPRAVATNRPAPSYPMILLVGLAIGLLSGTLGAGGGFLIVPALTLLLGVDIKVAIPTSLLVISVQSLVGFVGELSAPIPWSILLPATGVAILGLLVGLWLRPKVSGENLKHGFALMIVIVAIWTLAKIL